MNQLDAYLARVARELRSLPDFKRDDELRELRSHLEQRSEDFESRGLAPDLAQLRAIEEFGSARSVGSKLRDAWEGMPFSVSRLIYALFAVTLIWLVINLLIEQTLFRLMFWKEVVLLPELPYCLAFVFVAMPLGCGWLLSCWLGRRGPLVTLLYFGCFLSIGVTTYLHRFSGLAFSVPLPIFNTVLSFVGSLFGYGLHRRNIRLALDSGHSFEVPRSGVLPWQSLTRGLAVVLAICTVVSARVYTTFHPTTPTGVLRASLLVERGGSVGEFEAPTILEMRELRPATPVEQAGREKRVYFRVEARATEDYRARRITFLKKQLASSKAQKLWVAEPLIRSLKRVQRNRQVAQGTARLVLTSRGWQIDEDSFDRSQLWAWCYDIYYDSDS